MYASISGVESVYFEDLLQDTERINFSPCCILTNRKFKGWSEPSAIIRRVTVNVRKILR